MRTGVKKGMGRGCGIFVTLTEARRAKRMVAAVSSKLTASVRKVTMMAQRELPPKES